MKRLGIGAVVVALTFGAAGPAVAAPSPYLGTIAFESDRLGPPGVMRLFVMRPDGSGVRPLAAPQGSADASFSPDGRRVAFAADPEGVGDPDIFVMNVDGTGLRQLTDGPHLDVWPDWARGGEQIVFMSDRTGIPNIWIMNADGSGKRQLTNSPDAAGFVPVVSPTGRQIAYARAPRGEPSKIWVMNLDGTGQRPLTGPGPWDDFDPTWSPDERQIAFSSNRLGSREIFVMNADGSNAVAVTQEPGPDIAPVFSPDGRYIAWTAQRSGNADVWVMNADGSGKTRLTSGPQFDGFPDWHLTRRV